MEEKDIPAIHFSISQALAVILILLTLFVAVSTAALIEPGRFLPLILAFGLSAIAVAILTSSVELARK